MKYRRYSGVWSEYSDSVTVVTAEAALDNGDSVFTMLARLLKSPATEARRRLPSSHCLLSHILTLLLGFSSPHRRRRTRDVLLGFSITPVASTRGGGLSYSHIAHFHNFTHLVHFILFFFHCPTCQYRYTPLP